VVHVEGYSTIAYPKFVLLEVGPQDTITQWTLQPIRYGAVAITLVTARYDVPLRGGARWNYRARSRFVH
jgi:hypothetical protein